MCFQNIVLYFLYILVPRANELKCPQRKTQNPEGWRLPRLIRGHFPEPRQTGDETTWKLSAVLWLCQRQRTTMVSSAGGLWESSLSTSPSHSVQMLWSLSWPFKDSVPHSIYLIYFINIYLICVCPPFNQDLIFQYLCPVLRKGIGHSLLSSLSHHSLSFLDLRNLWVHWIPPQWNAHTHGFFMKSQEIYEDTWLHKACTLTSEKCLHAFCSHSPKWPWDFWHEMTNQRQPRSCIWVLTWYKKVWLFLRPSEKWWYCLQVKIFTSTNHKGRKDTWASPAYRPQVHGEKWG